MINKVDVVGLGSIIVDDVVNSNGTTQFGQIGGAAPYALTSVSLMGVTGEIWAFAGENCFSQISKRLQSNAIGTDGLICRGIKQPRAWQLFDESANRTEVFQTPWEDVRNNYPCIYEWVPNLECRSGYLFLAERVEEYAQVFRKAGAKYLIWEPPDDLINPERDRDLVVGSLKAVDIVVPNTSEWETLFNINDPYELIEMSLSQGIKIIALRRGENGAILASAQAMIEVPVEPVRSFVDFTGAGNAFAGALSAAVLNHPDPESPDGLYYLGGCASVASAITIESLGLPIINPETRTDFKNRLKNYLTRIVKS